MMEHALENDSFKVNEEESAPLPPRSEYHKKNRNSEETKNKGKKKRKNPFLFVRLLLAAFIILVVGTLVLSISRQYFS